ncbi:MAG: metallopeptidase TldD-related protein [Corallococcus sp.]|nr:metallopeptidase TldD-related protein [Bacillota bacterium]MCM1533067.1 metallopeptidase TldD-related protein [Corallococcus sp.]
MKTEKIVRKESSRCINVTASKVESLRINSNLENTLRVYDNGMIGVEGRLGNADFSEMEKAAIAKLSQGIPYPETHDEAKTVDIDATKHIFDEKEFIPKISALLDRLQRENPEFLFSNKVFLDSSECSYENSDGTNLSYKGNQFAFGLVIKYKGSANIMDESVSGEGDYFNEDEICRDAKRICDAFLNKLPQVEDDEVTVIGSFEPLSYAIQHFVADLYFNKASLLDGKLGQKIFNEKFNVLVDRSPEKQLNIPFFDTEGVVNDNYANYIVKDGVLTTLISDKKSSAQYGCANLGSADAPYNGVPSAGMGGFDVACTASDLSKLVKGKAVYLSNTGGGDMTTSGDISIPSIVSYLYEDGKLVGKLPEFTVTGNFFDIFGKDFVGVCENGLFEYGKHKYFVYKAKLVNKAK